MESERTATTEETIVDDGICFSHSECLCNIRYKEYIQGCKPAWPLKRKSGSSSLRCCLCGHVYSRGYSFACRTAFEELKQSYNTKTSEEV